LPHSLQRSSYGSDIDLITFHGVVLVPRGAQERLGGVDEDARHLASYNGTMRYSDRRPWRALLVAMAICLGQQGGKQKTLRAKGLEGSQKFFWETLKLFSSFLRGASCPKSPRFEWERLNGFKCHRLASHSAQPRFLFYA